MKKELLFSFVCTPVLMEKGLKFPSFFDTFFEKVLQFGWKFKNRNTFSIYMYSSLDRKRIENSMNQYLKNVILFPFYVLQFGLKKDGNFHTFSILFWKNYSSSDGNIWNTILFLFICTPVWIENGSKFPSFFNTFLEKLLQFGWKISILFLFICTPVLS